MRDGATNLDVGKRQRPSGPFALASPEPLRCLPTHKHQACKHALLQVVYDINGYGATLPKI